MERLQTIHSAALKESEHQSRAAELEARLGQLSDELATAHASRECDVARMQGELASAREVHAAQMEAAEDQHDNQIDILAGERARLQVLVRLLDLGFINNPDNTSYA